MSKVIEEAKKYLRRKAVAERYDIGERGVDKWAREGRIPKPVYMGKLPLWDLDALIANERAMMRAKPAKPPKADNDAAQTAR